MKKMYHIGLSKSDIKKAKYAILTGDPGRVSHIASFLKNPKKLAVNREYTSFLGQINNQNVLVISVGIGGPSMAIAVEELAQIGIKNLIRMGTSGGMSLNVDAGDLVIASSAIRQEGTSKEYVPIEFPAVADFDLTYELKNAAKQLGYAYHVGVVHCKDSFYGQHSPSRMPVSYELENKWNAWLKCGTLCSEMETAALYTVSSVLGLKASAILLVLWNQEKEKAHLTQNQNFDMDKAYKVAVNAIANMMNNK